MNSKVMKKGEVMVLRCGELVMSVLYHGSNEWPSDRNCVKIRVQNNVGAENNMLVYPSTRVTGGGVNFSESDAVVVKTPSPKIHELLNLHVLCQQLIAASTFTEQAAIVERMREYAMQVDPKCQPVSGMKPWLFGGEE